MTKAREQVINFLTANPESTINQIAEGLGKTHSAIYCCIRGIESNGLCERVQFIRDQWTYRMVYVPPPKVVELGDMAKGRVVEMVQPFKFEPWLSARPGADDHKRHLSMGALSKFKEQA